MRQTLPILFLLLVLTSCQFTQSPFVRTVSNAGSEFAAASTTLSYAHTGKISTHYAQASFVNYQSQLGGLDQQLPAQQGAPDKQTIEHLLALYGPALRAVNQPCLDNSCNWQAQVAALNRASQAFLKAGRTMKTVFSIALGIVTAIGGFLDAGTVATSGAAGAKFGLGLIWAILLATVEIILLVEMVGRFTAVSHKTYADAIREKFGFKFYLFPLMSELIAESLLLAAELGGVAIALSLFTGISWHYLFPVAAILVWLLTWFANFDVIENGPALLGLVTLSFLVGIFMLGAPKLSLLQTLWKPPIQQGDFADYLYLAAAILGATISPYLLYFYSSGAREEHWSGKSLLLNRITAIMGMGFGSLGSIALVVLAAIVLRPLNIQANTLGEIGLAMARPLGSIGAYLFAIALFATCMGAALEVVLAVSYNIAQGFGWEWGRKAEASADGTLQSDHHALPAARGRHRPDRHRPTATRALRLHDHRPFPAHLALALLIYHERSGLSQRQNQRLVRQHGHHRHLTDCLRRRHRLHPTRDYHRWRLDAQMR